jgi:hypothetical protein
MDDTFLLWFLAGFGLIVLGLLLFRWVRNIRRNRNALRRAHGFSLIHSLRAYSAWVQCQRDLPFTAKSFDELTSPAPLTRAREIKRDWFPSLSQHLAGLLQTHSRLIEYLWEQDLQRLSQGMAWRPAHLDSQYQQLRATQEELIDEMIGVCREIIGDADRHWQSTGSDFAFRKAPALLPQEHVGPG